MKRPLSSILVACLLLGQGMIAPGKALSQGMYDEAIEYLRGEGIAQGYADGSFRAEQGINRAEFAKIIMLAAEGDGQMSGAFCFRDVGAQWFAPYVCTARDHGMVSGYPDGTFRPAQQISFAEASSLIAKAYHGNMIPGGEWYTPYVRQLGEWNAIPPTVSAVHAPLTRGEMAYIIMMADHARDGTTPDDDDRNDDEDEDRNEDEEPELEISVRALQSEVAVGESVTFEIDVENEGGEDEFEIEATLGEHLTFIDAPGHDDVSGRTVTWEDVSLDRNDDADFLLVAKVEAGAAAGSTLTLEVEAHDEEESATVTVKAGASDKYVSPVGDPVLYWNAILLHANADDHTGYYGKPEQGGPTWSSRAMGMVHAAIYDAVNSVDRGHQPYIANISIQQNENVNLDAAVAAAAYQTLSDLFPSQRIYFDGAYQAHLNQIPDGAEKSAGLRVGQAAAQQVLAARLNDGSKTAYNHAPSDQPGRHRPDPLNPEQDYLGAKWGVVKPFVMISGSQFRAPAPPAITSPEYAAAYNEVKSMGGDGVNTPTGRSEDQTEIGLFWAYDGVKKLGTPPRLYNQIARVIALQQQNSIVENARLFALINLAMADAGIGSWESKYYYDVWRPIVGIREADEGTGPSKLGDSNSLTAGDANWTPLGAPMSNMTMTNFTPPFPAYPSGHATFGTAFFRILEQFYGTSNIAFSFTSDEMNGYTTDNRGIVRPLSPRSYTNLREPMQENLDSRIYLGVHWRFDQDAGELMGNQIADYVFSNALTPVR